MPLATSQKKWPCHQQARFRQPATSDNSANAGRGEEIASGVRVTAGMGNSPAFLKTIVSIEDVDKNVIYLAQYFMEVMAVDEQFLAFKSSLVGAVACYMARSIHTASGTVSQECQDIIDASPASGDSGYDASWIEPVVRLVLECCAQPLTHHLTVFRKYRKRLATYRQRLESMWSAWKVEFAADVDATASALNLLHFAR